jgi:5'-nucleotidase
MHLRRIVFALALCIALAVPARAQVFQLKIIAFNDLHGNLQSPGNFSAGPQSPEVPVGGVDYLAAYVAGLKRQDPDNVVVSAGDLTGASPLVSALFHDEPTIETVNRLGLEINTVGNHEFDKGRRELLRLQNGGCSTLDANTCKGALVGTPVPFEGAKFRYLAANVYDTSTGETLFPAYAIKTYHGVKIAFIGVTLKETPSIVLRSALVGLRFADEAVTINAIVRHLRPQGVQSFVVLIHQGGLQTAKEPLDINACVGDMNGSPIRPIVARLDDAVGLVISAHSHEPYICRLPNRAGRPVPVTSASSYGRVLTDIDATIDPKTKRITAVAAHNILVDRTNPAVAPNDAIQSIVDRYAALAAPIVNRVVGSVAADITRTMTPAGENAMGDLIADAQLEATSALGSGGAVAAFINEGGIRTGLSFAPATPSAPGGAVTFGELFDAQPFGNNLVTMTLTGAQIDTMLEQQFAGCAPDAPPGQTPPMDKRTLEVSEGFTYSWSRSAPPCHKVVPGSIRINSVPLNPSAEYRVTVNILLAGGGAQFYVLSKGTNRLVGPPDLDAMVAYFAKHRSVTPILPHRIGVVP